MLELHDVGVPRHAHDLQLPVFEALVLQHLFDGHLRIRAPCSVEQSAGHELANRLTQLAGLLSGRRCAQLAHRLPRPELHLQHCGRSPF